MNDQELLQLMANGNGEAFSEIYNKYWSKLFFTAYELLKDEDQSKDVIQDIFINLWERRESLSINKLDAYLYSSVRNNLLRVKAARLTTDSFYDDVENLNLQKSSADSNIIHSELFRAYDNLMKSMPKQRQKIFRMRHEDNMKTKAIAQSLSISQKTVQNSLLSAYRDVRALMVQVLFLLPIIVKFFLASVK